MHFSDPSKAVQNRSARGRRPRRNGRGAPGGRGRAVVAARPPLQFEPAPYDATPVPFTSLGLESGLERAIIDRGFETTTPIQGAVYPAVLDGIDLVACAQTGTGKTLAFLLPLMQRLVKGGATGSTRVLILAPTRELAVQIEDEFQGLAYHTNLSSVVVYGGVDSGPQERGLRGSADIVVATPGRLLDHMGTNATKFENVEVLVLDEADRMLDMGFWPSVRRIVASLPPNRQTLLFSATMSDEVAQSASQIMRAPKMIRVGQRRRAREHHRARRAPRAGGREGRVARQVSQADARARAWCSSAPSAAPTSSRAGLSAGGIKCAAMHADRTQSERSAAVEGFKSGRFRALIATDIAARGIDIEGIGHVVNYDVPPSVDAYVHRVGRTGRAEAVGTAVTLVAPEELAALRAIEKTLDVKFAVT